MDKMFFWMTDPPGSGQIALSTWREYLASMASVSLVAVVLGVGVIVFLYMRSASAMRVRVWSDVFKTYAPNYWLLLSLLGFFGMGGYAWMDYSTLGEGAVGAEFVAFQIAVWTLFWTALLSFLIVCMPGVTPPKFRYRPYAIFVSGRGVRK
ncbi:MAG: hypothetical protein ACKV2U_32885 [Bryobacteraceae bacterium]